MNWSIKFIISSATTLTILFSSCSHKNDVENAVDHILNDTILGSSIAEEINTIKETGGKYIDKILPENDTTTIDKCTEHFEISLGATKPEDVVIMNCHYWRSAHWTLEHEYYFEIEENQQFLEDLIYYGDSLKKQEPIKKISTSCPDWFISKGSDKYNAWESKSDFDDFQVYQDKESGNIFIHGSQY